ncbi:MAG TPA: asparagine synthase (glutamine-hydrolyzing) [Cyclobacteriaceae bacterium]|nr:asparagine synthase (glutamine-hydrolyzing) [Cyclobacteriaceae bacterium]
MCGIFGAIKLQGGFDDNQISKCLRAVDLVRHRGPDSQGHKLFTNDNNSIFLGHRRLSIIDLSNAGNQPMEDGGVWIVFNGEIFNYIEVREKLKRQGYQFKSDSDTEVILKTYIHYGTRGFNLFNGMWAFILYDSVQQKVIVSRDRFSIKPAYYFKHENEIYVASELRQVLLFHRAVKPNISTLATFLLQGILEHNCETFYQEISKIPAKSNMIVDLKSNNIKFEKYWDYDDIGEIKEKEAIERLQEMLRTSISLRLRSDVEIGGLLSGGLDSSLIVTLSNECSERPLHTFSVVSRDKNVSEEKFIDIMVREKKLINQKITFDPATAVAHIDQCLFYQEQPFAGASVVAQYMIYRLIKEQTGIKVVLSGQGGDEALMGYLKYFYFHLGNLSRNRRYFQLVREIFYSLLYRTAILQFNLGQAKRYIPGMTSKKLSYLNNKVKPIQIWESPSIQERQIKDIDLYSVPALTHYEDRNSMAHSIESRVPFLDHNVVNFLVQLPTQFKFKNGWSKYLLRKSFPELPESIRWRRDKKGFTVPEDNWCKTTLREGIENISNSSRLADLGLLDQKLFANYFDKFLNGHRFTSSTEIFSVYVAEKWLEKNFN